MGRDGIVFQPVKELDQIIYNADLSIQKAFDLMPVIVWISNPDAQCIFLNKCWYDYTGQTSETGLGAGWLTVVHPEDVRPYSEIYKDADEKRIPFKFEYRLRNSNGMYRWHLNSGNPQFDGAGNFEGFVGSTIDIHDRKESEERLRKSEVYYKTYAEAMPAMAFIADPVGNIIYFNKRWYEYIGSVEGTEGWGWKEKQIVHPDDLQKTVDTWNYSLKSGEPYAMEYLLRRFDGEYRWHLGKALPIRDKQGNIELWLGTNTDIHSLKQAEEALNEELKERKVLENQLKNERELLQTIFDTIPVMLSIYDPQVNVAILNKAVERITGWTINDHHEKNIMQLAYPDPEYRKMVRDYMTYLSPGFKDLKMMTKSGKTIEASWANVRISDGRNVGIGIDISERKAFELQLSKLSQQLHTVVENITDGVIVYTPDEKIISINKAAKQILSFLVNNKPDYQLNEFEMFDSKGNLVLEHEWPRFRVLRGEYFIKEEYRTFNKVSNKEMYLEYSGIPILENGELVLAIVTIQDITQRKEAHLNLIRTNSALKNKNGELEKINQLHENLLYIVAHDLRNPIGNMHLILELMDGIRNDAEKENFIGKLKEMVNRQENIVLGLVELLEVQSPEKVNPKDIELEELVKDIILENEAVLSDCGAKVNFNFNPAPILNHIPSFVTSILKNLINNAIKYRKEAEKLVLNISSMDKDEYLVISLNDNGIGIDLEKHKKNLFQPFKRFTRQSEGTGMGLYLIKNLIEKNGGFIEVESQLGVGTTFNCYFKKY
jgi:PAS domain S-box-containing protein